MNTINRSFFESLWIEVTEPLKEKLLINVAYCSNVTLSKFFLDELTSEISNVYSSTDNLILFGDYNINILRETGKQLDWSLMYKIIGAKDIFHKFIEIFQNVSNSHAPLKNIEVKTKKGEQKMAIKRTA